MGLFGGIGKALKGIDWDRVSAGLSAAGASAQGDHGTAAQAWGLYGQRRDAAREQQVNQQQAEAAVKALMGQGIPEADARVLVQSGAADTVLAQRHGQQADSEFVRTLKMAGIDPASPEAQRLARQRVNTMALPSPQPIVDPQTGSVRWVTPPAPGTPQQAPQGGPQPGAVVNGYRFRGGNPNESSSWEPVSGGGGGNVTSNFRRPRNLFP